MFSLVDCYFGGGGSGFSKIEGRDFSDSEMRIVRIALDACFEKMTKAWSVVKQLEFEYLYSEVNPQFVNIASPSETVISSVFRIELDQVGGELIFTMPNAMIDPLRQRLVAGIQSDKSDIDERWVASLRSEILDADVNLTAVLAEFQTTLGQVSGWQQGDIIPILEPEKILLRSDYVPVCHGSPGSSEGHYAIQIDKFVQPGTTTEGAGEILHSLNT